MKMRVMRRDGSVETISVVGPAEVHHGEGMDYLHSANGLEHWFLHDGTYDGWSTAAPAGLLVDERHPLGGVVGELIDRIERERKIEPAP